MDSGDLVNTPPTTAIGRAEMVRRRFRAHPFDKLEAGFYKFIRWTIVSRGNQSTGGVLWTLNEQTDGGTCVLLHEGESKKECIDAWYRIMRARGENPATHWPYYPPGSQRNADQT